MEKTSFCALCNTERDEFIPYFTQGNWVITLYLCASLSTTSPHRSPALARALSRNSTCSYKILEHKARRRKTPDCQEETMSKAEPSKQPHLKNWTPEAKPELSPETSIDFGLTRTVFTPTSLRLHKSLPGQYLKKQGTLILCLRTRWPKPVRQWTCFGSWHKITEGQWLLQYICYFIMRFCGKQSICALTLEHNRQRFQIRGAQI